MINHNSVIVACVCHRWEWDGWNEENKKQECEQIRTRKIQKRAKNEKRMKKNMCLTESVCMAQTHTYSHGSISWVLELELCRSTQQTSTHATV